MARTAIYLDANAGAPLRPEVVAKLREVLFQEFLQEKSGSSAAAASPSSTSLGSLLLPNASSIHSHGRRAKRWLAEARERIAQSLGPAVDPEQLIFTSSGTEANQLAVRSELEVALKRGGPVHWITTSVEHDCVIQLKAWAEARGIEVSLLPLDEAGAPQVGRLREWVRPGETALVSLLWVNNETGVMTDVALAASICRELQVPLHLDGAQAWGKLEIDLAALGARWVAFSSHKIGAPAGVGVLYAGRGAKTEAVLLGKQEKGRRAGTENLLGIIATGAAAETLQPTAWQERVGPLRDRLEEWVRSRLPGVRVNGAGAARVANTLNLSFEGLGGEGLVMALDLAGYSVSSGSACSSGAIEPSHVLLAMGRSRDEATSAIRLSLHESTRWEELEGFGLALEGVLNRIRSRQN